MRPVLIIIFLIFQGIVGFSQNPVNAYANVTAITGNSILSVGNVDETYDSFKSGDAIIIMQMQDNVIGTNTTNTSSFGNIGSIQSAGLYEIAQIASIGKSSGVPVSITLTGPLTKNYNINSNASVQIITFHDMGNNYSTSGDITALSWNGTIGGVIAMFVTSVFTVRHNITADASGFRGGGKNLSNGSGTACDNATYISTVTTLYAQKGEGIYKVTNTLFDRARGKILNGGGGGNKENAGGGGGANFSAGGNAGPGWNSLSSGCSTTSPAGGIGGIALGGAINGTRFFMGGGGGGGHENNGVGTVGAAGGGIIIIKTGTLTTSSCIGVRISADGGPATNSAFDGAGGGGGGGTIFLQVNSFNILSACPLTVSANGGNGANVSDPNTHSGGGGGGQGAIIYNPAIPSSTSVTNSTQPGTGGVSCNSCVGSQNATAGSNDPGSVMVASFPLPVELISFSGEPDAYGNVHLNWRTAKEINNHQFIVQRLSNEGVANIGPVDAKGDYSVYELVDKQPGKGSFQYRLLQEDNDGTTTTSHWIDVFIENENDIKIYPNPISSAEDLVIEIENKSYALVQVEVINLEGITLYANEHTLKDNKCELDLDRLPAGAYILKLSTDRHRYFKKLIKG